MQRFLTFSFIVVFLGLLFFTTGSLMTVKSNPPVSTIVIRADWGNLDRAQRRILAYAKQGYVVTKTFNVDTQGLIIMEKH